MSTSDKVEWFLVVATFTLAVATAYLAFETRGAAEATRVAAEATQNQSEATEKIASGISTLLERDREHPYIVRIDNCGSPFKEEGTVVSKKIESPYRCRLLVTVYNPDLNRRSIRVRAKFETGGIRDCHSGSYKQIEGQQEQIFQIPVDKCIAFQSVDVPDPLSAVIRVEEETK